AQAGLSHGSSFRTIHEVWQGPDEALSRLELPPAVVTDAGRYRLHPGLLDGALQTAAVLIQAGAGAGFVPYSLGAIRFSTLASPCYAHVERRASESGMHRFRI